MVCPVMNSKVTHNQPTSHANILEKLIAFPTLSLTSNLTLIEYVQDLLTQHQIECEILYDETKSKANLFATTGPKDKAGIVLSGHCDVVPVDGQAWTHDPFTLTVKNGKYYGRGTADMKGFLACAIEAMIDASQRTLQYPLHLAISYDEEIGCVGVRGLLEWLEQKNIKPLFCLIGEPTSMQIATGHKGKCAMHADFHGTAGHSALASFALNAIYMATDFVREIQAMQQTIINQHPHDDDYDVPYSTLHVGKIHGGTALNIVPNHASIDFEYRYLADDNPDTMLDALTQYADKITAQVRIEFPDAAIKLNVLNQYPGLDTPKDSDIVTFFSHIIQSNHTIKVAFGTEAGLFYQRLASPAIIMGPGSMEQGHKADEFVTIDQMAQCQKMLATLLDKILN